MMHRSAVICVTLILALSLPLFAQSTEPETETYGPRVAGFFYPKTVDKLQKLIAMQLEKVITQEIPGRPVALISPMPDMTTPEGWPLTVSAR